MKRIPILIDSDPGIDDSFAIALANYAPDFEIRAITAVEGNVPAALTRKNALCIAQTLEIDCRVGFGAELPLRKPYIHNASFVHGESGVGDVVFPVCLKKPDEKPAWEILYEEAVKAKGELVLFAIGPLTNIALALRAHPDLPDYIARCCIMGGGTFGNVEESGRTAEFNIWVDPTAAKEVFEKLDVYMVGLNATHQAAMTDQELDELLAICQEAPQNWFLRELTDFSKRNRPVGGDNHILHDALAVASMMEPSPVRFEDYYVTVEDRDDAKNNGETVIDLEKKSGKQPNCHVAVEVDRTAFVSLLKKMCRFYNETR